MINQNYQKYVLLKRNEINDIDKTKHAEVNTTCREKVRYG